MDQNSQESARRVIHISKKKLILTIIVLIILVIVGFVLTQSRYSASRPILMVNDPSTGVTSERSYANMPSQSPADYDMSSSYEPNSYPYRDNKTTDITDTREFLKTTYSANIKTRNVASTVTTVKNIVKGADGRVDDYRSSEKSGYVSFVVAKSKFEAFRAEVEALTNRKLYAETISSQNRLGTKQNIEERLDSADGRLTQLKSEKQSLENTHSATLSAMNRELSRIQGELLAVRQNIWNITDDTSEILFASWKNQETALITQEATQKERINIENTTFNRQKLSLDNQITNQQAVLTSVGKQDTNFMNDIETVNGSVYVNWVSMWQLAKIFSPISPVLVIIILIGLVWMYLNHKKITPKIVII